MTSCMKHSVNDPKLAAFNAVNRSTADRVWWLVDDRVRNRLDLLHTTITISLHGNHDGLQAS